MQSGGHQVLFSICVLLIVQLHTSQAKTHGNRVCFFLHFVPLHCSNLLKLPFNNFDNMYAVPSKKELPSDAKSWWNFPDSFNIGQSVIVVWPHSLTVHFQDDKIHPPVLISYSFIPY